MQGLLEPRERLLWSGTPKTGLVLRPVDALYIPFTLLWAGFAIFWEITALSSDSSGFFPLFGIPFVRIGLYLLVGRFFFDAAKRKRTVYGLTDRRAIIISKLFAKRVDSIPIRAVPQLTLSVHQNGRGTVTFGNEGRFFEQLSMGSTREQAPRFEYIEDAQGVHALIREVMNDTA